MALTSPSTVQLRKILRQLSQLWAQLIETCNKELRPFAFTISFSSPVAEIPPMLRLIVIAATNSIQPQLEDLQLLRWTLPHPVVRLKVSKFVVSKKTHRYVYIHLFELLFIVDSFHRAVQTHLPNRRNGKCSDCRFNVQCDRGISWHSQYGILFRFCRESFVRWISVDEWNHFLKNCLLFLPSSWLWIRWLLLV